MDQIIIKDLEVFYRVGVPDEERAAPQRLLITVVMEIDFNAAASHDDIRQTINYFDVAQRVKQFGEGRSWKLIETVAMELAGMIRQEFGPASVTVEVNKFILPDAKHVSVRLHR